MNTINRLVLDTNRHHLHNANEGFIKDIQLSSIYKAMTEEFEPRYKHVGVGADFETIHELLKDVYAAYDNFLAAENNRVVSMVSITENQKNKK